MSKKILEDGTLLPVLARATHEELEKLVTALNKGLDVFVTWDERYERNRNDLTKIPEFVEEYILRAGAHGIADRFRQSSRSYGEIVQDACRSVGMKDIETDPEIVALESRFLQHLLDKALKRMKPADREAFDQKMREAAGPDISLENISAGGAKLALLLPMSFAPLAEAAITAGLTDIGAIVAGRAAGAWLGPIGLVLSLGWTVYDIAGPSLRATVPAVAEVALIRQRLMWNDLQ